MNGTLTRHSRSAPSETDPNAQGELKWMKCGNHHVLKFQKLPPAGRSRDVLTAFQFPRCSSFGTLRCKQDGTGRSDRGKRRRAKLEIAGVLKKGCGDLGSMVAIDGREGTSVRASGVELSTYRT